MRTQKRFATVALVVLVAISVFQVDPAEAQLANASASWLGLSGNNTATVRGFGAIAVNPAGLGMPGSGFSIAIPSVRGRSGLDPITVSDLAAVQGILVSNTTKEDWLTRVANSGSQSGSAGARLTGVSLSMGNFGLQVSTIASAQIDLAPSIVEAILYGNAGRTGQPVDLSLSGSSAVGFGISTVGVSFAIPIASATGDMSFGVTGKYLLGHGLAIARDQGGLIQSNPIRVDVDFPMVLTSEEADFLNGGSGMGLDVGFMMKKNELSFGASVQNLINTFAWDESELVYRPGLASLSQGSSSTDFDERPFSGAPASLKTEVADLTFNPALSLGVGLDVSSDFTVTADLRNRFGDGINITPKFALGAGAEYRGLKVLHVRGGLAKITDGIQYSGGLSLVLGPLSVSAAAAARQGDLGEEFLGQFTLSIGGR